MPAANPTDWTAVDWQRPTADIARETGRAVNTVSKMRAVHAPETVGQYPTRTRNFSEVGKARQREQCGKNGRINQPKATAAALRSPKAGRGESNVHAKHWTLQDPYGTVHRIANLHEFVRANPALFLPEDVKWKRSGGKRGTGGEYCNATAGIANLRAGKARQWKGWIYLGP
jgi:hypothetical protein